MKTIKCYTCKCGEDFYEDDTECVNCGTAVDPERFKDEPLAKITHVGDTMIVEVPLVRDAGN